MPMSNDKKQKYPISQTPRGRLIYPHLNTPDTKFNADGEYRTRLAIPLETARPLMQKIDAAVEEALAEASAEAKADVIVKMKKKGPQPPYSEELDAAGNPTGNILFSFKCSAEGEDKKTGKKYSLKPAMFDAKGKPCDVALYSGTTAIVAYTMFKWGTAALGYGVSLRPKALQIIELAKRSERDASGFGFAAQDEGFSSDEFADMTSEDTSSDDTADSSSDDAGSDDVL